MSEPGDRQAAVLKWIRDANKITLPMIDAAINMLQAAKEARHGKQAGGTQPPAESQEPESMGVQR